MTEDDALALELEDVGFVWLTPNEREAVLAVIHRERAAAHAAGRAAERAKVVAFLERWIDDTDGQDVPPQYVINAIERGQHKEQG